MVRYVFKTSKGEASRLVVTNDITALKQSRKRCYYRAARFDAEWWAGVVLCVWCKLATTITSIEQPLYDYVRVNCDQV